MPYGDTSFIPTNSTALYLKTNGNALDSGINGNNGTATNVTYVGGRFGQSARFNGTTSKIDVPDSASLRLTTLTISMWIRLNATSGAEMVPLRKDTTVSTRYFWGFSIPATTTQIRSTLYNGSGFDLTSTSLGTGTYRNCVMTITSSSGIMSLYVDGLLVSSIAVGFFLAPTNPLGIGYDQWLGNGGYTNADIDEIIIENRVWSAKEVATYYSQALGRYSNLII